LAASYTEDAEVALMLKGKEGYEVKLSRAGTRSRSSTTTSSRATRRSGPGTWWR
jgi:hypothetical protein